MNKLWIKLLGNMSERWVMVLSYAIIFMVIVASFALSWLFELWRLQMMSEAIMKMMAE